MDALVMCGGRGTRLAADVEKPLLRVGGEPMVERVCRALLADPDSAGVDRVHAVVSPHAPSTADHLRALAADRWSERLRVVDAPGEGYVEDLSWALDCGGIDPPVLSVSADLPLLTPDAVETVLDAHDGGPGSTTVAVPVALKRLLGISVDEEVAFDADGGEAFEDGGPDGPRRAVPAGINVVGDDDGPERTHLTYDARLAVNVNRIGDARISEVLL